jgi:hypothetical protein
MDDPKLSSKGATITAFAASYLKAPSALPGKWLEVPMDSGMELSYLKLLNRLSRRTDIAEILAGSATLERALERTFLRWMEGIYPKTLLKYFKPQIEIYLTPDGPDYDESRDLKIDLSNMYINWNDFDISQEIARSEELWPGTGVAVLNALTKLPYRHYLWTPENVMEFIRDMFWCGYETEHEFLEAEYPDHLTEYEDESDYLFTEEKLGYLKQWEKRTPARKYVHPVGRELLHVCREVGANKSDSMGFGTTFPEIILWSDEENVLGDILEKFELDMQQCGETRLHAGGTQWRCEDLKELDETLDQIELYIREKEALADALINFKMRMKPWLETKKRTSR